jgi:polyferredoxin
MKIGIHQMKIGICQMKIEIRQMNIEIRQECETCLTCVRHAWNVWTCLT